MEIISYLDSTSIMRSDYSAMSLEDLLKKQRFSKRKPKIKTAFTPSFEFSLPSIQETRLVLKESLIYLKKRSFVFAILLAISFCILLIPFTIRGVSSFFVTPTLRTNFTDEETFIQNAMVSFIHMDDIEVFNNEGVISESNIVTYTQPVTYQNYTVKKGDNISNITRQFGLTNICTLIAVNRISNVRTLQPGKTLSIPSMDGIVHIVQNNETLAGISVKYNVTVEDIVDVNDMESDQLKIGEKLFIPGGKLNQEELRKALGELFLMPLSGSYRVTSLYGYRADPFTGAKKFHTGVDFAMPQGTPIKAAMSGKVITAGWSNIFGYYVILSHANGYQTLYGHMQKYSVKYGQYIYQGDRIGYLGSTGYSTGPHLHFSVYKNSKLVNPATVLKY